MQLMLYDFEFEDVNVPSRSTAYVDIQRFGSWQASKLKTSLSVGDIINFSKDDKTNVWRSLFGDIPMPLPEDGIIEKNFGILNQEIKTEVPYDSFEEMFDSEDY
ncbi:MAG: hypothetical protein ACREAK_04030 [Nitrosarchaeum sp.]